MTTGVWPTHPDGWRGLLLSNEVGARAGVREFWQCRLGHVKGEMPLGVWGDGGGVVRHIGLKFGGKAPAGSTDLGLLRGGRVFAAMGLEPRGSRLNRKRSSSKGAGAGPGSEAERSARPARAPECSGPRVWKGAAVTSDGGGGGGFGLGPSPGPEWALPALHFHVAFPSTVTDHSGARAAGGDGPLNYPGGHLGHHLPNLPAISPGSQLFPSGKPSLQQAERDPVHDPGPPRLCCSGTARARGAAQLCPGRGRPRHALRRSLTPVPYASLVPIGKLPGPLG